MFSLSVGHSGPVDWWVVKQKEVVSTNANICLMKAARICTSAMFQVGRLSRLLQHSFQLADSKQLALQRVKGAAGHFQAERLFGFQDAVLARKG